MLYARDKRTGQDVPASKAKQYGAYVCPTCREEVMLRAGGIRVRHFAHRSGRADPDCDRYYPGSAISNPLNSPTARLGDSTAHIDPLSLGVRIEAPSKSVRHSPRQWRLVLVLPKAPSSIGQLRLPVGKFSRTVRLHELAYAGKEFDVSPQLTRFGPEWVSDDADYDYRDAVTNRINGFDGNITQAFAITGGRIKPHVPTLTWGDSYVLIQRGESITVPDLINPVTLAPHDGWSATVVSLPVAPDESIKTWLDADCGLRVANNKRQWGVLYPPPVRIDANGDIEVYPNTSLALGFVETGDATESPADLLIQAGGERHMAVLKREQTHLYAIARDGGDARLPLHLQWGGKGLPAIVAVPPPDPVRDGFPEVVLHLRRSDGDMRIALHHADARHALDDLRRGRSELLALTVPQGITGRLRAHPHRGPSKDVLLIAEREVDDRAGSWALSVDQREVLSALLCDATADIHLSFGAFGYYAAASVLTATALPATMSSTLRRRIRWYVCAHGGLRGISSIDRASDDRLVKFLQQRTPLPHLTAHRNVLLKQIDRRSEGAAR